MSRNIEARLVSEISPLTEFLGAERVSDLKDKVCQLILNQVEEDLRESSSYYVICAEDVGVIADEALEEIREKLKKKFKNRYLEIAEEALAKLPTEKGGAQE